MVSILVGENCSTLREHDPNQRYRRNHGNRGGGVQMQRTNNLSAKYLQRRLVRGEVERRMLPAKTIWIAPLTKPLPDGFDC